MNEQPNSYQLRRAANAALHRGDFKNACMIATFAQEKRAKEEAEIAIFMRKEFNSFFPPANENYAIKAS